MWNSKAKHLIHSLVIYVVTFCRKQSIIVLNQLLSSSGIVLCNELIASRSTDELCGLSTGYHLSHKRYMSLFVKWLDSVARSLIEKLIIIPLNERLYNLQETILRSIT